MVFQGHEPAASPFPQERNKEIPFYLKKKKSASNKQNPPSTAVLLDGYLTLWACFSISEMKTMIPSV